MAEVSKMILFDILVLSLQSLVCLLTFRLNTLINRNTITDRKCTFLSSHQRVNTRKKENSMSERSFSSCLMIHTMVQIFQMEN